MANGRLGICPNCLQVKYLTKHHVLPKRFYKKQRRPIILMLCRDCHNEIEKEIPYKKKLERRQYIEIAQTFLRRDYAEATL